MKRANPRRMKKKAHLKKTKEKAEAPPTAEGPLRQGEDEASGDRAPTQKGVGK